MIRMNPLQCASNWAIHKNQNTEFASKEIQKWSKTKSEMKAENGNSNWLKAH